MISDVSWCSIIAVTFPTSNFAVDVVMSNTPKTLNEVRRDRASTKRKITNMLKEGDSLLTADSGLPSTEFRKLADRIREELDILHVKNELYINSKCSELVLGDDATEEKRGFEEETIADSETNYLDEVRDRAMPMIHELIKIAERVLLRDLPPIPISPFPAAHMQKLKFPTFSGDIRDYKQFKELFIHFTKHLDQTECRENVRLHGVPETAGENTDDVVIGIAHDMGVDISSNDISASHRLPKSRTMKERPIIVKFVRRNTKTTLMMNKKTLRTIDRYRHIYINDDLTPLRSRMLRTLQNDDEVKRVWTIDGNFNCVVVENNAEVKKRLETPDDLFKLGWSQEKMMDSGLFVLH